MRKKKFSNDHSSESKLSAINIQELRGAAGEKIYERGEAYYHWGRVEIDEITDHIAICYVQGNELYRVNLSVANDHLYMDCDCPFAENGWICKHHIAAALAVYNHFHQQERPNWRDQLSKILRFGRMNNRSPRAHPYYLFFSLQPVNAVTWKLAPYILPVSAFPPNYRIQEEALPPSVLREMLETNPEMDFHLSKPATTIQAGSCLNCGPEHVMLANLIQERNRGYGYYPTSFPLPDYLTLAATIHSPIYLGTADRPVQTQLEVLPDEARIHLEINTDEEGMSLQACAVFDDRSIELQRGDTQILHTNPIWVLARSTIFPLAETNQRESILEWLKHPELFVPLDEEFWFPREILPPAGRKFPDRGRHRRKRTPAG